MFTILSALATPPSISVLPTAEHGPAIELRGSARGPLWATAGEVDLTPTFVTGVVARWRRLRFEGTTWRDLSHSETTGVVTAQVLAIDNDAITVAPWVMGSLVLPDKPCRQGCREWSDYKSRGVGRWVGGGVSLAWHLQRFSIRLAIPFRPTEDSLGWSPGEILVSGLGGSHLSQELSLDVRLPTGPLQRSENTARVALRRLDLFDLDTQPYLPYPDPHPPGLDLAWRHARDAFIGEIRVGYSVRGPDLGFTTGSTF